MAAILVRTWLVSCALLAAGCGGNSADDADTDTGSEIDTDWDGGPLTPCEGGAPEGMVCVPGGKYLMGCMPYDIYCEEDELPLVEVSLSPFWVDVYETTYEELLPFLNTLKEGYTRMSSGIWIGEEPPFDGIIWMNYAAIGLSDEGDYYWSHEGCDVGVEAAAGGLSQLGAEMYCEWQGKRLPTEAQWEAAARGQTALIYPCAWLHLGCWYGNYGCGLLQMQAECYYDDGCCIPYQHVSAGDCPSQCGAEQMTGNAAEWVLDRKDYANNDGHGWCAEGCSDPEPQEGAFPIVKGGGTLSSLPGSRISAREMIWVDGENDRDTGVRCVSPVSDGSQGGEKR
jgi:formylglycine-generating enzyme required for sulfatase activity